MKNLLTFLLILFINYNCFAQEAEKLPEMPWENIAEMNLNSRMSHASWKKNVNVKLLGFYNKEDSLIVSKALAQLDTIINSIDIGFSKTARGNLEILFMDSTLIDTSGFYSIGSTLFMNPISVGSNLGMQQAYDILFIDKGNIKKAYYENILRNKIAKCFVNGYLGFDENQQIAKNRNSIFNSIHDEEKGITASREPLNKVDVAILKAVYEDGFQEKMELAIKQFYPIGKITSKAWWKSINPLVIFILPFGIVLILAAYLTMFVFNVFSKWIKNRILLFNIKATFALFLISGIFITYGIFGENWPEINQIKASMKDVFFTNFHKNVQLNLFVLLPGINLVALMELLINRLKVGRNLKLVLYFISTSFIPYFLTIAFIYFVSDGAIDKETMRGFLYLFVLFFVIAGFRSLISFFVSKEKDLILENETKLSNLRELKSKAELNVLHSRINPHFLYNSLNSIAGLAHDDANKTEHMALSLSKLFRYSINKEKSDWTTFNEELEMVRIYLDVEKVRFDDRLNYSVEISEELEEQQIPRFIIQPLVENAVKHGIAKSVSGGEIKVSINKEGRSTTITVSDSGQAFPDDLTPGFGIQSIYDKLEILYKDKFEMNFTNSPQKQVTLKLK